MSLVRLAEAAVDITQRYAAMGMFFLASDPEVRVLIVQERKVAPFVALTKNH